MLKTPSVIDTEGRYGLGGSLRPIYIGETSRLMRTRTFEHMAALGRLDRRSFQLQHWMECHGTSPYPPKFKFEVLNSFKDPLSRQLCEALEIIRTGNLNRKGEFKINDLCRLVTDKTEKEKEDDVFSAKTEKKVFETQLENFIDVMRVVICKEKIRPDSETNLHNTFRIKTNSKRREKEVALAEEGGHKEKKRRMDSSTPKFQSYRLEREQSPAHISPIPREQSPLQVDPEIFEHNLSGLDQEPAEVKKENRCF